MHITPNDPDSFCNDAADWPVQCFPEVYAVTQKFSTSDPTLFSPLLTNSARSQALSAHVGRCLNCGGTDHSMKLADKSLRALSVYLTLCSANSTMVATSAGHGRNGCGPTAEDNTRNTWSATPTATRGYRNNNGRSNHGNNNQGNNSHSNHGRNCRHHGNSGRSYNNGDNQSQGQHFQQR